MTPQTQSRIGANGRCLNACLASILEIAEVDVPDFPDGSSYRGSIDKFLKPHGVRYVQRSIDREPPSGFHLIEGISPRGGMHAVVGYNGEFRHDPHPAWDDPRRGLVKPVRWGALEKVGGRVNDAKVTKKVLADIYRVHGMMLRSRQDLTWAMAREKLLREFSPEALDAYAMKYAQATDAHGTRPGDVKHGKGAFTIQVTEKDGREHVEPVGVLRAYDSQADEDAKIVTHAFKTGGKSAAVSKVRELTDGQPAWVARALFEKALYLMIPGDTREARLARNEAVRTGDSTLDIIAILAGIYAWYIAHKEPEVQSYNLAKYVPKRRVF